MSGNSSNENDNLPPWLRDLQLPASPTPPPASSPQPSAANDADDIPDWLRSYSADDARASMPEDSGAEALPDWLQEPQQTSSSPNDLPDWLQEPSSPAIPEWTAQQQPSDADTQIPDWLRLTSANNEPPVGNTEPNDVPEWLRESMEQRPSAQDASSFAPPARNASEPNDASYGAFPTDAPNESDGSPESPTEAHEDVPAWLRDVSLDEVRQVMNTESEPPHIEPFSFDDGRGNTSADVPSWLQANQPDTDDGIPAWLSTTSDTPTDASEGPVEPFTFGEREATGEVPSWLQADAPAGETGDVPSWLQADAPAGETGDVPSWLQADAPTEASGRPAEPFTFGEREATGDVPSWLQADTPTDATGDVPSWLQADAPTDATGDVPSWLQADAPAGETGDVPSWLQMDTSVDGDTSRTTPEGNTDRVETHTPAQEDDIPVWLRGFNLDTAPTPSEPVASTSSQDADIPDWLKAVPAEPETPSEVPAASFIPDDRALPAWMIDEPNEVAEQTQEQSAPIREADDVPAWLREDQNDTSSTAALPDLPPWLEDDRGEVLPTAADANLPTWLRGADHHVEPRSEQETLDEAAAQADTSTSSTFLGEGDLPSWLVEQPQTAQRDLSANDRASLDWLTKLNATDDDLIAPAAPTPAAPRLPLPTLARRSEAHVQAVALLSQIAATPYPDSKPLPETAPPSFLQRIGIERFLYALLLIGLIVSLTIPSLLAPLQVAPTDPGAAPLLEQVNGLGPSDVVLIGYEWDARRVGELTPLKDAVIGQLIAQNVKMILVSTDPQGTLLSYDLRDELRAAGYNAGGSDYVLLGYKPGNELALRLLAQDLLDAMRVDFQGADATEGGLAGGIATGKPVQSIRDVSMVLVLADEANDVQGWMEQVRPQLGDIPVTLLLSAESAPLAQPYTRLPNVYALSGQSGALAYQQLRAGDDATALQAIAEASAQQRLGLLVFTALLLLGALVVGIAALTQRGMKRR